MTSPNGNSMDPSQAVGTFEAMVIDPIRVNVGNQVCTYAQYLARPKGERENDEANVVDQQFARNVLRWLGFDVGDWNYNQPQNGQKANRPDYILRGSVGTAFIWEDKNSTLDLELKHLQQMRRYTIGTAGYAVWCNMRRILAVRFLSSDTLKYDILADISIAELFSSQPPLDEFRNAQATNLALFQLLFGKARFTQFDDLSANIKIGEADFEQRATDLDRLSSVRQFINDSRQSLSHLRLAALAQIREALRSREQVGQEETELKREWEDAKAEFLSVVNYNQWQVEEAIAKLKPGECETRAIRHIEQITAQSQGTSRLSNSLKTHFDKWLERAERINGVIQSRRFQTMSQTRIADAYQVWSNRQTDEEDIKPEIFAEQVAYVFFVRLLLVRVLEDKKLLSPRIASDGGYRDWADYVSQHFQELNGVSIINDNYCNLLARKAGHFYLHFFQQPVFDWFNPDDFLLVETLEFLCRYTFRNVSNDIIGFTYEEYIDRTARNRKGHFLTRPDVVEYMLDILDYRGTSVIGRRILDPACGSGSFLVHAARRYRQALVASFCNTHNLADEQALQANAALRTELASRYVEDVTTLFFGMELTPFACYLAEMNLLIQVIDDLFVLQQAGRGDSIDRFQIINTDSLHLPREVLYEDGLVPDRLSDRLADEAHPIKAKLEDYKQGFFYVIFNPPYVTSKREELNVARFKHTAFYATVLSGDTNLYLLFLKLGLYYIAEYGQMTCIIPLTIFGDKSASAARHLLRTAPFSPAAAIRFYRGDILFPGVDQAVGIVRVNRLHSTSMIQVAGGNTTSEAAGSQFQTDIAKVIDAVPENGVWNGAWLVTNDPISLDIWQQARRVSLNLATRLSALLNESFEIRQGDVNATYVTPLRIGLGNGSFAQGHIAIYKGEDVVPYAPLPTAPSDWVETSLSNTISNVSRTKAISSRLAEVKRTPAQGIVLREVARLNTRERLIATWFKRDKAAPKAFTHETWRMTLKQADMKERGKALLALLNSKVIAYLLNLFSTNNHVGKEELFRIPIPDPQTFPATALAALSEQALTERAQFETDYVNRYGVKLPDSEKGTVYVPPSSVLMTTPVSKLTLADLVARGEVRNNGAANGRIRALRNRNLILSAVDAALPYAHDFATVLNLFLEEPGRQEDTWMLAQSWQLPDPITATSWLQTYQTVCQQAQENWNRFVTVQLQVDDTVADWYGFNAEMRTAIAQGLPWARRRPSTPSAVSIPSTSDDMLL